MKLALSLPLLLLAATSAFAEPIDVGGKQVDIRPPSGFVRVTPEMTKVSLLARHSTSDGNHHLAMYIPESVLQAALADELPEFNRYFIVSASKDLVNRNVTKSQFASVKKEIRALGEKSEGLDAKTRQQIAKANKEIANDLNIGISMKLGDSIQLPSHYSDRHSVSYSQLANLKLENANGQSESVITSGTITLVHVMDRILFVTAYGSQSDLEWTRESSAEWISSIVFNNGIQPRVLKSINRDRESDGSGANAKRLLAKAVAALIVAAILYYVHWLINRSAKS